jgi:hypothetical protein
VSFVFGTIEQAVQGVLDVVNAIFGTDLQARQIIMIALLGQFLGVFRLIGSAATLLRVTFLVLTDLFGSSIAVFISAWAGGVVAVQFLENAVSAFGRLVDGIIIGVGDLIVKTFSDSIGAAIGFFVDLGKRALSVIASIIEAAKKLPVLGGLRGGSDAGPDNAQRKAGGGSVRGPGSSSSDSIPAWLSNGEWVIRAAAVRKYGHGLLAAINSMRLPVGALSRPGFALGGLVHGYAGGGPVSAPDVQGPVGQGARPFSLTIGGETFRDLIAPADVADRLVRFASGKNVRRLGRAPSWYR